jgi:hypothetical protein
MIFTFSARETDTLLRAPTPENALVLILRFSLASPHVFAGSRPSAARRLSQLLENHKQFIPVNSLYYYLPL